MKKLSFLLLFAGSAFLGYSNSVTIKLFNNSNSILKVVESDIHNGSFFLDDHGYNVDKINCPVGEVVTFRTGAADVFAGTDGFVEFEVRFENRVYQIHISFNNPFIGSNEFRGSASPPFIIKYLSGGDGSEAVVSFELTGGPTATPPPSPINLPVTGNHKISGYFSWDINETGLPENEDLTKAFTIAVKAPTLLMRSNNGSGNATYLDHVGYLNEFSNLKNIKVTFTDARSSESTNMRQTTNIMSAKRTVRYVISNLPENIPVDVSVMPAVNKWKPGVKAPPPAAGSKARWNIFLHEKSKTENSIKYEVCGGWFNTDGSFAGDVTGGLRREIQDALKKKIKADFLSTPATITDEIRLKKQTDIYGRPGVNKNRNGAPPKMITN